jgi:hypothetical protein
MSERAKKPTWSDIKTALSGFSREALLALVRELCDLSPDNKQFLHTRFQPGESLTPYKAIITKCMYPNVLRNHPVQIAKAKKAISDFRKAAGDTPAVIDLMIHFVECGTEFTQEYGDIDGPFYDALLSMYARAVEAVQALPPAVAEPYRQQLHDLAESAEGIGWNYYDDLCATYEDAFPG